MLETKKRPKNFFFLPSFFFPIYIYMHMLLYVRIPKGERTRNRPWSKGRFALATRIECTGLPSFSSRTTMRHKGGRTRQPHNARASVPFSRRVFVVPSVPLGLFTIFFSLRHQRPADTHFAGREVKLAPLPGCREGFFCVQPLPSPPIGFTGQWSGNRARIFTSCWPIFFFLLLSLLSLPNSELLWGFKLDSEVVTRLWREVEVVGNICMTWRGEFNGNAAFFLEFLLGTKLLNNFYYCWQSCTLFRFQVSRAFLWTFNFQFEALRMQRRNIENMAHGLRIIMESRREEIKR